MFKPSKLVESINKSLLYVTKVELYLLTYIWLFPKVPIQ